MSYGASRAEALPAGPAARGDGVRVDVREAARAFRPGSPGGSWALVGLGLAVLGVAGGLLWLVGGAGLRVFAGQWVMVLAPLAAAAACMGARRAAPDEARATWLLLGMGSMLAAGGQALHARALLLEQFVPFPSMAFHLMVAFHVAFAEAAILALRPAHEGRSAAEIALDGVIVLLAVAAVVLRTVLDPGLSQGILDPAGVVAVLVGQLAVMSTLLFAALLVVWRDTALAGPVVDGLLVTALFFAFGNLLVAFGVEGPGVGDPSFDLMRLAGWLALFLTAGTATIHPRGGEAKARRELAARRFRQLITPAAALFVAAWAVDASRRPDVTTHSLVVVGLLGVALALRIVAALYAIEQESTERRRAEGRAARARLRAVTARMNPHFLFNALHSLSALVRRDTPSAEMALERLGALLRYGLDSGDDAVLLREEWAFARDYLELEAIRLGERLTVVADVRPEALDHEVPPFIIQPLVENAIRHGVSSFPEGGRVEVRAWVEGARLIVEVGDSGPGAPPEALEDAPGVGLRGVRAQLEAHFDTEWSLESRRPEGGGFVLRITMPADPG